MKRSGFGFTIGVLALAFTACSAPPEASTIVFADGDAVTKTILDGTYTNAVSGVGDGALSYASDTPATASVDAATGLVTIHALGTTRITATKAETETYPATSASYTLTVILAPSTIVFSLGTDVVKQPTAAAFTNEVSGVGDGTLSYSSATPATASVDASTGLVTIHALGAASIRATRAATAIYAEASLAYELNVVQIGSAFRGGKVAYFLKPRNAGYDANREHGLIAALADAPTPLPWCKPAFNNVTAYPNPSYSAYIVIGGGPILTPFIVAQNGLGTDYAAGYCDAYVNPDTGTGVFDDWYLPSRDELAAICTSHVEIGGFRPVEGDYYASSSEVNGEPGNVSAMMGTGYYSVGMDAGHEYPKYFPLYVRPARSF